MHLAVMHKAVVAHNPEVVVVDPLTNLLHGGTPLEVNRMILRLVDYLKGANVTSLFTSLTTGGGAIEGTDVAVSSLMDTWLLLRDVEIAGERNRLFYVLKSRGTAHSNQVREFRLTSRGAQLIDVYVGTGQALTGSARVAQEAREAEDEVFRREELEARERALDGKRIALTGEIARLQAVLATDEADLTRLRANEKGHRGRALDTTSAMATKRGIERPKAIAGPAGRPEGRP